SAHFGKSLAAIEDVDGDNVPDIIVGAPGASPNGIVGAGRAFVYSGASGQLLYQWDGLGRFDEFAASVAGGGDVDGDNVPDIIVGAPGASPTDRGAAGSAFVFSGATGEMLFRWDGEAAGDPLGRAVAIVGDLNGDGRADVLIGAPYAGPDDRR